MKVTHIYNQFYKAIHSAGRIATGNTISEKIFFLHIPKCGGTSVDAAIMEAYAWKTSLHLDSAASRKAAMAQNRDLMLYRNNLLPYFMEQSGLRYISGHFVFDSDLYTQYSPQWQYITFLRNPVQKYISQYFYNLQKPDKEHFGIEETIENFIESAEGIRLGQDMVQKITGSAKVTSPGSTGRQAQVELAIHNIEKFRLVGILEDVRKFETDFKNKFGASIRIKKKNSNKKKDETQVSPSTRKKIEKICEPDTILYKHVKKMLYG